MCTPSENIKFCTCTEIKQVSAREKFPGRNLKRDFYENEYLEVRFTWNLSSVVGETGLDMVGMFYLPVEKLSNVLTEEGVIEQLNHKIDLFDFDYTPKEGDNLLINREYVYAAIKHKHRRHIDDYMSFIYKEGAWVADIHNSFLLETQQFSQGFVEVGKG